VSSERINSRGGSFLGFLNSDNINNIVDGSVDLFVSSHSLEHLIPEEIRVILSAIRNKLVPERGLLFIEIPLELEYPDSTTLIPPHTTFFTEIGLVNLLQGLRYEIVDLSVNKGHKYKIYKKDNRGILRRVIDAAFRDFFVLKRFFPSLTTWLYERVYPETKFDYMRVLCRRVI
jgi:hypothetical protein